jgi:hypothetical protein
MLLRPNFHLQVLGFRVTGLYKEYEANIWGLLSGRLVVVSLIVC